MKINYLPVLILFSIPLSCSKPSSEPQPDYANLILGKWKHVYYITGSTNNGSYKKDTTTASFFSYSDHRSDGKVYSLFDIGSFFYDTSYYKVIGNNLLYGRTPAYTDTGKIEMLNNNKFILYTVTGTVPNIFEHWNVYEK